MNKFVIACFLAVFCLNASAQQYNNFKVSVYCRAYEVMQMDDTTNYLKPKWDEISRQLKVDKVYLETHRDLVIHRRIKKARNELYRKQEREKCV